jgi:hypothetical protein
LKDKYHCKNWDKSLNNTYIDNNITIYPCKIYIPAYGCLIDILGPYFDASRFIRCNKRKKSEKTLLLANSNLKNEINIKRVGYPITIIEKQEDDTSLYCSALANFVKNNLINMDNENKSNMMNKRKKPEIIIDFTNDIYGKIKININFNKELSKMRKNLEKRKNNNNSNNILFFFSII